MRFARVMTSLLLVLAPATAWAQGPAALSPHRAVYDLRLDKASESSDITGISGRMVYDFDGSPCEGYTVTFRFVTDIQTSDASRVTDQQTTTFEEGSGQSFRFVTKSFVDSVLERELRGEAKQAADALEITLDKPQEMDVRLPAAQFPTQHMLELLGKAQQGETFYETSIFDGSEDGDKAMTTAVVIGKPTAISESDPENAALKTLAGDRYWPVDIAYFDLQGDGGEETPDYRVSFKLHSNGLTHDLVMDYGDFAMTGKLVDLQLREQAPTTCEPATPR